VLLRPNGRKDVWSFRRVSGESRSVLSVTLIALSVILLVMLARTTVGREKIQQRGKACFRAVDTQRARVRRKPLSDL